ncbi:hypothetical protein D1815_09130 [Aquimarina sp. AD1]|uniref:hypothetical protein n=1 Tax=Aquimarina sp. (strain AD1) TaxID=1714848 RepID=UPI000E4728A1|nr:hypothetical protein [Aquimarina sp. AD1]AXT55905.1 hypothetical protein D1815_09130 [Aquimarina sp. AD1]RKN19544.1 hypothetical protein D7035_13635 [Aquimarina sp. AD1]
MDNLKKSYSFLFIGFSLLVLYLLQFFLDLKWQWLYELQLNEEYKRWSGVFIGIFILFQWILSVTRISKKLRKHTVRFTILHKWIGVLSPIFFYIHALEFGYGYLALLSYIFFINMVLGTVNLDIIKSKKEWIFQSWMIVHVLLSVVISFLVVFHIGVVFYYE